MELNNGQIIALDKVDNYFMHFIYFKIFFFMQFINLLIFYDYITFTFDNIYFTLIQLHLKELAQMRIF